MRTAEKEIKRLEQLLERLPLPHGLLHHRTTIVQLHEQLGSYLKAANDRPVLVARRQQASERVRQLLEELKKQARFEDADSIQLPRTERRRVLDLAQQWVALQDRQQAAEQGIRKLEGQLQQLDQQLQAAPPPRDPSRLEQSLRRVQRQGDLDQQLADATRQLELLQDQAKTRLGQLPRFHGTLEQLQSLAIPAVETIDRFDGTLAEAQRTTHELAGRMAELTRKKEELEKELAVLQMEQDVPTEADLLRVRRRRDEGWQMIQNAWSRGMTVRQVAESDPAAAQFIQEFAPGEDLPAAYRASVEAADTLADRLRREADRVARKARLTAELQQLQHEQNTLQGQYERARQQYESHLAQWRELWQEIGIEPLPPREMRAWRDQYQELMRLAEDIGRQRHEVEHLRKQLQACRAELQERLLEAGFEVSRQEGEPLLAPLADEAERALEAIRGANQQREKLAAERQKLEQELVQTKREVMELESRLQEWQDSWAQTVQAIGLDPSVSPCEITSVVEVMEELIRESERIRELNERIEGIDRDAVDFRQRVQALLQEVAPDLMSVLETSIQQAVADLVDRLRQAEKDEQRLENWQEQLENQRKARDRAAARIQQARQTLDELCRQAGCSVPEQLPAVEEKARQRRAITEQLERVKLQLAELAAGVDVDTWVDTVRPYDVDRAQAELSRLDEEIHELEAEKTRVAQEMGMHRNELSRMDGSGRAAEAQIKKEHLLASLRSDVEQYVRLRLALEILEKAMDRYREASQGPVLERAGRLFSRLTLGSFSGLRIDFDDQGRTVLVGVRPDGQTVGVAGMSDGTCDQLYLALRLASLEASLEQHEPFPFIVDDILVMFDDHRATAALEALSELSRKTQVIFFTHHRHLLTLLEQNRSIEACVHVFRDSSTPPAG